MPMYDYRCECGEQKIDVLAPISQKEIPCVCGKQMQRTWLTRFPSVIGDEIDIEIKHGLCWDDGTPRRFRSKQELARATKEAGLVNRVEHVGSPGSDKNKQGHTTRWV
jgi:hypothetical protein